MTKHKHVKDRISSAIINAAGSTEKSVAYYKGDGFGFINGLLRYNYIRDSEMTRSNFKEFPLLKIINNIDSDMRFNNTGQLYRGVARKTINSSGSYVERGYSSSSPDADTAQKFASEDCCMLLFTIPSNIRSIIIDKDVTEPEVVVDRNMEFYNINFAKFYINKKGLTTKLFTCAIRTWKMPSVEEQLRSEREREAFIKSQGGLTKAEQEEYRKQQLKKMMEDEDDMFAELMNE